MRPRQRADDMIPTRAMGRPIDSIAAASSEISPGPMTMRRPISSTAEDSVCPTEKMPGSSLSDQP